MGYEFPIDKFHKLLDEVTHRWVDAIDRNTAALVARNEVVGSNGGSDPQPGASNGESEVKPREGRGTGEPRLRIVKPEEVFDMETAIKASGQWECLAIHCRNCDLEQNLECLGTYQILAPELPGDDPASVLHSQDGTTQAPLTAAPPAVTVPARKSAGAKKPTKPPMSTKAPLSDVLEEMKRSALVKMAAGLGIKEAIKRTKADLIKLIARKQKSKG